MTGRSGGGVLLACSQLTDDRWSALAGGLTSGPSPSGSTFGARMMACASPWSVQERARWVSGIGIDGCGGSDAAGIGPSPLEAGSADHALVDRGTWGQKHEPLCNRWMRDRADDHYSTWAWPRSYLRDLHCVGGSCVGYASPLSQARFPAERASAIGTAFGLRRSRRARASAPGKTIGDEFGRAMAEYAKVLCDGRADVEGEPMDRPILYSLNTDARTPT